MNFKIKYHIIVFYIILLLLPKISLGQSSVLIQNNAYKFHSGDDPAWALPGFDDSSWESFPVKSLPDKHWNNIGWFRYNLEADSTYKGFPMGLAVSLPGAWEIYLNGNRICQIGKVGLSESEDESSLTWQLLPIVMSRTAKTDEKTVSLLAIRYTGRYFNAPKWSGYNPLFSIKLGDINALGIQRTQTIQKLTLHQYSITSICLVFSVLFLFLYLSQKHFKINLYYAVLTFMAAVNIYFEFHRYLVTDPQLYILSQQLAQISFTLFALACLRFMYAVTYFHRPKPFWSFSLIGVALCIWTWIRPFAINDILFLFMFVVILEIVRVFIITKKKEKPYTKTWIIGVSAIPLILATVYELLRGLDVIPKFWEFIDFPTPFYGMLFFVVGMSVFLARQFAQINRSLENQLLQVKKLSAKTLKQERNAKKEAIKRAVLEAENARKSHELEEARALQLSMLPDCDNDIPGLDLCFHMDTATEVGGDYYDYLTAPDESLIIAIGDATGHGMKAGILVSVIKSLFVSEAAQSDILSFFQKSSQIIRKLRLSNLYMSFTMIKIKDHKMTLTSAGMPPVFIYRAETKRVEQLVIKALPLGGMASFPYQKKEIKLKINDVVLLMSDGFPELFNEEGEMLDYPRIETFLKESAEKTSTEIVDHLVESGKKWRNTKPQDDDITFVVIKVKDDLNPLI